MKNIFMLFVLCAVFTGRGYAGAPWVDAHGTSSTAGAWNSGIRSDTQTEIYPPYVMRWEKYEWREPGVNVVPFFNSFVLSYNNIIFFGESNQASHPLNYDPGYVWAWDAATGVTKTGYPLGPLDSGVISFGGGLVIAEEKLYALSQNKVYGWDISGPVPEMILGFPVDITETADEYVFLENGLIYWNNKLYFASTRYSSAEEKGYLYVISADSGEELWRKELESNLQVPAIWEGRAYGVGRGDKKLHCWDAETGAECADFPVAIIGNARSIPLVQDGAVYFGTHAGYFYSIDAVTGGYNWIYTAEPPLLPQYNDDLVSSAAVWENKIYFGGDSGRLYGLYKETGEEVEGYPTDRSLLIAKNGPISTANGLVYANNGWRTSAVNAENGSDIVWQSEPVPYREGGVSGNINYQGVTIGENEIISVYPGRNTIIVYEMPSPTATSTITPTHTATGTQTPTLTITLTQTATLTHTNTPTLTVTQTITPSSTQTATSTQTPVLSSTATATLTDTETVTATQTPYVQEPDFYLKIITNYPNPFDSETHIVYELGRAADITLKIFTLSGERAAELQGSGMPGKNSIRWDGKNHAGYEAASGIYIYSIEAVSGEEKDRKWSKMAVLR